MLGVNSLQNSNTFVEGEVEDHVSTGKKKCCSHDLFSAEQAWNDFFPSGQWYIYLFKILSLSLLGIAISSRAFTGQGLLDSGIQNQKVMFICPLPLSLSAPFALQLNGHNVSQVACCCCSMGPVISSRCSGRTSGSRAFLLAWPTHRSVFSPNPFQSMGRDIKNCILIRKIKPKNVNKYVPRISSVFHHLGVKNKFSLKPKFYKKICLYSLNQKKSSLLVGLKQGSGSSYTLSSAPWQSPWFLLPLCPTAMIASSNSNKAWHIWIKTCLN